MTIALQDYRNKLLGCWMGKNIGGTLGAPFEWYRQVNQVEYYTQDLKGEPLPNDDLDIQLLWLIALEQRGVAIDQNTLAEYFNEYVTHSANEYGICKLNLRQGLLPPFSGSVNNSYKDSCGAFIRSEIWACIAPGCPSQAARYALSDGVIDHGDGEGTYGAIYCAALESAAFVESDIRTLIDVGLSYVPEDCGLTRAVRSVISWYDSGLTWLEARERLIAEYRGHTHGWHRISPEDKAKGYGEGRVGYDIPSNIGILVLGLMYGEGDFDRSICTIVNCGEDTDCTAATYGSMYGIINGVDAFEQKWTDPIGRGIKTISLDLANLGGIMHTLVPKDIDELSARVERVMWRVQSNLGLSLVRDGSADPKESGVGRPELRAPAHFSSTLRGMCQQRFAGDLFDVWVDYCGSPFIENEKPKCIELTLCNKRNAQIVHVQWYFRDGMALYPAANSTVFLPSPSTGQGNQTYEFTICVSEIDWPICRLVIELTVSGKPDVMLVPVALLNGNGCGHDDSGRLRE